MKLIIPKKLVADPVKLTRALTNAMNGVAKDIQIDFKVTTQTWKHKVEFPITSPETYTRRVATDDEIYGYVNDGTPAHHIAPKGKKLRFNTPFTSKTLPNQIMSRSGSIGGATVFSRGVNHPGTKARKFDVAIQQKWDKQFGTIMQRAIDSEMTP
jgi:hypothetical protein